MEEEETSADYDTYVSNDDDEHVPLFRSSFPVNSHFKCHSIEEVNRYLIIIFLFLCIVMIITPRGTQLTFWFQYFTTPRKNREFYEFYDRKFFSTLRKKVKQA